MVLPHRKNLTVINLYMSDKKESRLKYFAPFLIDSTKLQENQEVANIFRHAR